MIIASLPSLSALQWSYFFAATASMQDVNLDLIISSTSGPPLNHFLVHPSGLEFLSHPGYSSAPNQKLVTAQMVCLSALEISFGVAGILLTYPSTFI